MESWALRLKDLPALQQRQGALASQLSRARQAEAELGLQRTRRRTIQAQLQNKAYGGELRRQLKQLKGARLPAPGRCRIARIQQRPAADLERIRIAGSGSWKMPG